MSINGQPDVREVLEDYAMLKVRSQARWKAISTWMRKRRSPYLKPPPFRQPAPVARTILKPPSHRQYRSILSFRPGVRFRSRLNGRGIDVRGYPSTGGVLYAFVMSPIDAEHINIPRFEDVVHAQMPGGWNQDDEDAFCERLLEIGPRWEPFWDTKSDRKIKVEAFPGSDWKLVRKPLCIGWPRSGGCWVLEERDLLPEKGHYPIFRVYTCLHMVDSMEERCELLSCLGAKYYRSKEERPDLFRFDILDESFCWMYQHIFASKLDEDPIPIPDWISMKREHFPYRASSPESTVVQDGTIQPFISQSSITAPDRAKTLIEESKSEHEGLKGG